MARPIITLLTDFGTCDSYVAQMKGILLSRCPDCSLVDVTHHIPPQDIRTAAQVVAETVPWFPAGTVHVAVVDPGVGTERGIIAAEILGQRLVLPDNGLISPLLGRGSPRRIHRVTNSDLWNQIVSPTFHGRDIFAPVAAFLATGGELSDVGPAVDSVVVLPNIETAQLIGENCWLCRVLSRDSFGNLALTSCDALLRELRVNRAVKISLPELPECNARVVETYGNAAVGELVLLRDSQNRLELAQVKGSACKALDLHPLQSVKISLVEGSDGQS